MASPQKENGFLPIANELVTALKRLDLSRGESKIFWTVLSHTYGWQKKVAKIALTIYQKDTGLSRSGVCRAIRSLVNRQILGSQRGDTSNVSTYWIQKNYEKWLPSQRIDTSPQIDTSLVHRLTLAHTGTLVNGLRHNKDNVKQRLKTYTPFFENIWKRYPNQEGKKLAFKHFLISVKTEEDQKNIEIALNNYINLKKVKDGFVKNGATWFNNWRDYIKYEEPKTQEDIDADIKRKIFTGK